MTLAKLDKYVKRDYLTLMKPYAMMDAVTAKSVKPAGPVLGILRAYLTEGNPPGGGPS